MIWQAWHMQAVAFNLINRGRMMPQVIYTYPICINKNLLCRLGSFCCDRMKVPKICAEQLL